MSECKKEFATLIRATLQYLQDEWGEHIRLSIKEPPPKHSKEMNLSQNSARDELYEIVDEPRKAQRDREVDNIEDNIAAKRPYEDRDKIMQGIRGDFWDRFAEEKPKLETPAPLPVEKKKNEYPKPSTNWTLNPLPLPAEFSTEFSSLFRPIPLSIPIHLVAAEQSQIFFLESVARALTKLVAPAALYSGKLDLLLTNSSILLILAPLSLLKKRFPQVELHQLLKFDGPALLPLADHYDLELKRALWNTLKSFQNMLPSSLI